jgi:hypothetical protein
MKLSIVFALHLAALVATTALSSRQVTPKSNQSPQAWVFDVEKVAPQIKPASVIDAKPKYRADSRRQITRFGPFNIPGQR